MNIYFTGVVRLLITTPTLHATNSPKMSHVRSGKMLKTIL
jgi:hypothetical protein